MGLVGGVLMADGDGARIIQLGKKGKEEGKGRKGGRKEDGERGKQGGKEERKGKRKE